MRSDRKRLTTHAAALLLVAAAVALRAAVSPADPSTAFAFFSVAIAVSAWIGGISEGITAVLAAVLAARLAARVDLAASALFAAEGLAIVWLTAIASRAVSAAGNALAAADARTQTLLADQRRLRRIEAAAARVAPLAVESAAFVVDDRGRIVEWAEGPARLFGQAADSAVGESATQLFASPDEGALEERLAGFPAGAPLKLAGAMRRGDGTTFDADVEIHRVDDEGRPAYVIAVRDRTREQGWRAFADASADVQKSLREDVETAHRQLATLQHITDPSLNLLPHSQAITALLDRLRDAIEADGVAVIRTGRPRRPAFAATDGLKPDAAEWRTADGRAPQAARILIVHNDPERVSAASAAGWGGEASSLIAVPIVAGSHVEGTIEAVRLKARRSTEWEIALVQVVAAQIAGRLQDASMFGTDAVA